MISNRFYKTSLVLLFITCLAFWAYPLNAEAKKPEGFDKAIEQFKAFYLDTLKTHGIVGSTFMFLHDNQILTKEFYGLANREQNRKVDEDTIYQWASITKTLTGIAIMQLRDRGRLKLDDPIIKYLPELREVHNPYGDMSNITLRHLMSHSAGFRSPTWPWKTKPWQPHEPLHWEQIVAMIPYTEVQFKPGSKWQYSNPGIIFLGRVIELLTTDDWEVYIAKNIFMPLEMHRSYFDTSPYHLMKHKAQSYTLKKGELIPAIPDVNTGITVSNGGLKCPFPDFIKYMNFLMGNSGKQDVYDQVLKRSSLEEMWQNQIEIPLFEKDFAGENRKDFMALTYFIEENFGMRFVCHSGGQNAFVTHFYFNPESRTTYIVGFNTLALDKDQSTRAADRTIKEYLFKNIFPLFESE